MLAPSSRLYLDHPALTRDRVKDLESLPITQPLSPTFDLPTTPFFEMTEKALFFSKMDLAHPTLPLWVAGRKPENQLSKTKYVLGKVCRPGVWGPEEAYSPLPFSSLHGPR